MSTTPVPAWFSPSPDWDDDDDIAGASQRWVPLQACLVSVFLHTALLVVLATIFTPRPSEPTVLLVTSAPPVEPDPEPIVEVQRFRFTEEVLPTIGSPDAVGAELLASVATVQNDIVELPQRQLPVEVGRMESPLTEAMASAPQLAERVKIKGAAGVGAIGTVGSVDRITQEILLSLEQRPTLVVWMFDRSGSMQVQRDLVRRRFERIYRELQASDVLVRRKEDQPLLTSVVSFGQTVDLLTPEPTASLAEIDSAVARIPNDDSGVELVFTAVGLTAQRYKRYCTERPRRNVMIVVFTDEVGDDEQNAEAVTTVCRKLAIPVYVVGVPAPFGRRDIEVRYVDPDPKYDQSEQWIPVRQGPETLLPETVALGFTGHTRRDDKLYRLDSGFGPYWLTRLCHETGGIYFSVHPNRPESGDRLVLGETPLMAAKIERFFDPTTMRNYLPDYLSPAEYRGLVQSNRARSALVQAAQMALVMPMANPRVDFERDPENEASLKRQLDEAQKAAAILEPRVNALYQTLKAGEPDRPKLTSPRWQAGFDLALGRVLAVKVRTETYNQMLARAKQGLKLPDPRANQLRLQPANEISVGSQYERQAAQARELLQRVRDQHASTPWAYLAEVELSEPIGWRWTGTYVPPPPPRPATPPTPVVAANPRPQPPPSPAPPPKPKREVKL